MTGRAKACPICGDVCGGSVLPDGKLAFCGKQPGFGHGLTAHCACGQVHDRRGATRPMAQPQSNGHKETEPGYDVIAMSEIKRQPVHWLWPDKLAHGKLSIVFGDGDKGKSWSMLDLAARLSTGTPMPNETDRSPVCNSLLLMSEDDPGDTIGPRLDAQRADSRRVLLLRGTRRRATTTLIRLQRDMAILEAALVDHQVKLLVIDGMASYMAGSDGINEIEVRQILLPLSEVAQRTGAAIVAIMHIGKGERENPLHRIAGSVAFGNVARCVLGVDDDPLAPGRRVLLPIKGNIIRTQAGVGYRIQDGILSWDADPVAMTKDTIFKAGGTNGSAVEEDDGSRLGEAKTFLRTVLEHHGGKCAMRTLLAEATADGLKEKTIRRAKKDLAVDERLVYEEDGNHRWYWLWPTDDDTA